jgi:hypothetical protein
MRPRSCTPSTPTGSPKPPFIDPLSAFTDSISRHRLLSGDEGDRAGRVHAGKSWTCGVEKSQVPDPEDLGGIAVCIVSLSLVVYVVNIKLLVCSAVFRQSHPDLTQENIITLSGNFPFMITYISTIASSCVQKFLMLSFLILFVETAM